jgi:hypothetical protein
MHWGDCERRLAEADRTRVAAVVGRAAQRLAPVIADAPALYGPEAWEWWNVVSAVLAVVERFVQGRPVSRFTLDLAADLARSTAVAGANATRIHGPSPAAEQTELTCAAAAFAADVCRAPTSQRAATCAVQGLRAVDASGRIPRCVWEADLENLASGEFGELWPGPPPEWWSLNQKRFAEVSPPGPQILSWPTTG